MSPELKAKQLRVMLTWENAKADLELFGQFNVNTNRECLVGGF